MKNLDILIRRHQCQLDEKRRKVAELERLAKRFRSEIEQLEKGLRTDQEVAGKSTEAATCYGSYEFAILARREKLQQSLAWLESEMVQAVEDVATAFQEYKKINLMRVRHQKKAELKKKRTQQKAMDEPALNFYRRASSN